ncbi:MAG: ComEC/Rec2 family competence protein [Clostridia bacterium]|nr:ComEC/Rec2 family competence protein [Clostridia bacterium]
MKRPILVAVIGYIIGIILGLYIKFSIVLFYAFLYPIIVLKKYISNLRYKKNSKSNNNNHKFYIQKREKRRFKIYSIYRYFRYIKLILNHKVIITIIIFSILSNTIVLNKNKQFTNLYKDIEDIEFIGEIQELKKETQYKKVYIIKVKSVKELEQAQNTNLYLNLDKTYNFECGDQIKVEGKFCEPDIARNYGGFNYKEYLKTINIYGTVNVNNVEILKKSYISNNKDIDNSTNSNKVYLSQEKNNIFGNVYKYIYEVRNKIKQNVKKYLNNDIYPIYLGLMLGDTSYIDTDVKEQFRDSNMSHILAVSGMHISYIILGVSMFFNKALGKKKSKIVTIFILIIFSFITGFSPSIVRACVMGIMILIASLIHRKSDTWTTISFSLLLILIYNPYLITSISLQYTYAGTIGIILFNKNILKILNKGRENESKIKEIVSISLSAQIFILPLTIFHFNTFGIYFLITNFLLSFIIGPIVIISFIFLITLILDFGIAKLISIILNLLIKLILLISKLSFLPMAKIYIPTPKVFEIIFFYIFVILINSIYSATHKENPNISNLRVKYMLEDLKYKFRENKKKLRIKYQRKFKENSDTEIEIINYEKKDSIKTNKKSIVVIVIVILVIFLITGSMKELKIHFVDVGQGDCCFIETPGNKTILIDGGGSEIGSFDVGKSTLIPYILDRGYTKIDYIIISHFDTDHVRADY